MHRVIGLLSGKGGVGKTTVSVNLGASLAYIFKKNVVILDMNVRSSHVGLHLGIYEDPLITLNDILKKGTSVIHSVYIHPPTGLRVIPAPLNGECKEFTRQKVRNFVREIKNNYDILLLDCAPGLGKEVVTAVSAIDEALVVTTPDMPAVADAIRTLKLLRIMKKNILGVILNRGENRSYMLTDEEVQSACESKIISKIPEDKKIPESIAKGVPVVLLYPNCAASKSLIKLASFLSGEIYYEKSLWDKIKEFLGFGRTLPLIKGKAPEREQVKQEIVDVEKMKEELRKEIKEELKKEIVERVRRRLSEKYAK
jgi:septum site-determining protein MinD